MGMRKRSFRESLQGILRGGKWLCVAVLLCIAVSAWANDITLTLSISGESTQVFVGEPFMLYASAQSTQVDLRQATVSISPAVLLEGGINEFQSTSENDLLFFGEMQPRLHFFSLYEDQREEEQVETRFLLNATAPGILNVPVLLETPSKNKVRSTITLQVQPNASETEALRTRYQQIVGSNIQSRYFRGDTHPDHFNAVYSPWEKVFPNEQFLFFCYAVQRLFPEETLQFQNLYYYVLEETKADSLWYSPVYTVFFEGDWFAVRKSIIVATASPEIKNNATHWLAIPQLHWLDEMGMKVVDEGGDTGQSLQFLKNQNQMVYASDLSVESEIASQTVFFGEPLPLTVRFETPGFLLSPTVQPRILQDAPGATEVFVDFLGIKTEESVMLNELRRTYSLRFDAYPQREGTYTFFPVSFRYFNPELETTQTAYSSTHTFVVIPQGRESGESITSISLFPLRPSTRESVDQELFAEGVRLYQDGHLDQAFSRFVELSRDFPYSADVQYNLGFLAYESDLLWIAQLGFYRSAMLKSREDALANIQVLEREFLLQGQPIHPYRQLPEGMLRLFFFLFTGISAFCVGWIGWWWKFRQRKIWNPVSWILLACWLVSFVLFTSFSILEQNQPDYAVIHSETAAYAGPGFDFPETGNVAPGNVLRVERKDRYFVKGYFRTSVPVWIPRDNTASLFE